MFLSPKYDATLQVTTLRDGRTIVLVLLVILDLVVRSCVILFRSPCLRYARHVKFSYLSLKSAPHLALNVQDHLLKPPAPK